MPEHQPSSITVLGAGSWGTALAVHLARQGHTVWLWSHDQDHIQLMQKTRSNPSYLPNTSFPDSLQLMADLSCALQASEHILLAVPSSGFVAMLERMKHHLKPQVHLLWATKGADIAHQRLLSDAVADILGPDATIAMLSGPSFASEVARGLSTAVVIASPDRAFARKLQHLFTSSAFRVDLSTDVIGVQVASIMKNIFAIAAGVSDGLGRGANARCALMTYALAEMIDVGLHLGATYETFCSLAGIGDLWLTCGDNLSRNRRFGLALVQGRTVSQVLSEIGQVVEGIDNTAWMKRWADQHDKKLPIVEAVDRIVHHHEDPQTAFIF